MIETQQPAIVRDSASSAAAGVGPGPWVAALWALTFGLVHAYWAAGGQWALPDGMDVRDNFALLVVDLAAIPLCGAAAWLALALGGVVRPWPSRRHVCWAGAATSVLLVVHAAPAVVEWIRLATGARAGDVGELEWFSLFVYEPWFLTGGILFALATLRAVRDAPR